MSLSIRKRQAPAAPGEQADPDIVRLDFDIQTRAATSDLPDNTVRAIISTEDVDRYNTIFRSDGMDAEAYMKNPVVFFNHASWTLPIARSIRLERAQDGIQADIQFDAEDDVAMQIYGKIKRGFLNGVSIRARILERSYDEQRDVTIYLRWELMGVSIVGINGNGNAVVTQRDALGAKMCERALWQQFRLIACAPAALERLAELAGVGFELDEDAGAVTIDESQRQAPETAFDADKMRAVRDAIDAMLAGGEEPADEYDAADVDDGEAREAPKAPPANEANEANEADDTDDTLTRLMRQLDGEQTRQHQPEHDQIDPSRLLAELK